MFELDVLAIGHIDKGRAVGEGVFGALKTRLNGKLRNLRLALTQKEALLLVVCYILRVYMASFLSFFILWRGWEVHRGSAENKGLCGRPVLLVTNVPY